MRKAQGVHIGRIAGSHNKYLKLTGYEDVIQDMLFFGISKAEIARRLNVDRSTLWRFLKSTE